MFRGKLSMKLHRAIVALVGVNMRRGLSLLVILLVCLNTLAQSDEADDTYTVTISADERASIEYIIENEAEYITIQAQSVAEETDSIDPVIWVVNSQNHLLAYNDNFGEDNSAKIDTLLLVPDTYTIWIDSFNGVSDGDVEVIISLSDPFNEIRSTAENSTIINVSLPQDAIYRYALELSENDTATISVRDISGTLDPYISVLDENDSELVSNDDHQSMDLTLNRLDSLISDWLVSVDGIYTIEVRDFLGNSGEFELVITINTN